MRNILRRSLTIISLLFIFSLPTSNIFSQEILDQAETYVRQNLVELGLESPDLDNWILQDFYTSENSGLRHIYWKQTYQGIPVESAILNLNIYENGEVFSVGNRFIANLAATQSGVQQLDASAALGAAANSLEIPLSTPEILSVATDPGLKTLFEKSVLALEPMSAERIYLQTATGVRLAWKVQIYLKDGSKWWNVAVDAENGSILQKVDQVLHCSFERVGHKHSGTSLNLDAGTLMHAAPHNIAKVHAPDSYRVYPMGTESPSHGNRTLEVNPADATASPFGWHDTNGADGAEYTITRGNNVLAAEDRDANNTGGFSPDGGAGLDFDFNLDFNQDITANTPVPNESAAITNLFYWNNIIHDVFYRYGFDEAAGNFQENNYGNGGAAGDHVLADAQDGNGLSNANFSTPTDGGNGRMQMFLWGNSDNNGEVIVNSPGGIAGTYASKADDNAPGLYNITSEVILADDGSGNGSELCNGAVNGGDLNGKIALIDESGSCSFYTQASNAQSAGALAVIIIKDGPGNPSVPSTGILGLFFINVPVVMLSEADGDLLKTEISNGNAVNVTMKPSGDFIDGDFDNGIIAHEYGHGISIRLTGGPGANGCLQNAEHAGEGWSDWFGIVLTHQPSHTRNTSRGIGTYALEEPVSGPGIRTYPYSTDMAVNPHTYDAIKDPGLSAPHGVGSVFAVMLYDLYWNLIDQHGYDTDLYGGTGGNNIAIQLVIDGLKLQPCSPGFVDMRDAILAADQANYGGANEDLIWQTFARRGLGFSATQGNTNDRTDGSEAFDLPPSVFPVELLSFSGRAAKEEIQLDWQTGLEQNNRGFEIQRFHEQNQEFVPIGWVDGIGNSDTGSPYQFTDREVQAGISYTYRLKQMDFDGLYSYSGSVTAELNPNALPEMTIYPNPNSTGQLRVDLLAWEIRTSLNVSIFDNLGRKVVSKTILAEKTQGPIVLDVHLLDAGLYTIQVQTGGARQIQKLIIK